MFKNPIEAFIDWYKSIPPAHQEEIASHMAMYFPGFDCEPIPGSYVREKFLRYISQQQLIPMKAIGTSIALDSIIGFSIMNIYDRKDLVSYQAENLKKLQQRAQE